MKVISWATLTANGNYALSSAEHPPQAEALEDFRKHAVAAGNFVVGRHTFENNMRAAATGDGSGPGAFDGIDVVIVSSKEYTVPGMKVASSPQEALEYLQERGHATVLVSGGEALHNAFLSENLVDELIINIAPVLEGQGMRIELAVGLYKKVQLIDHADIGGGIIQMRYAIDRL